LPYRKNVPHFRALKVGNEAKLTAKPRSDIQRHGCKNYHFNFFWHEFRLPCFGYACFRLSVSSPAAPLAIARFGLSTSIRHGRKLLTAF
jgi:hypothetical protein